MRAAEGRVFIFCREELEQTRLIAESSCKSGFAKFQLFKKVIRFEKNRLLMLTQSEGQGFGNEFHFPEL